MSAQQAPPAPLRVEFLAVGQGDAALVISPIGKTVLIDAGPTEAAAGLVARLRARGVGPIDLVLLTHRHADHLGGMPSVIEDLGARMFMDSPFAHRTDIYRELIGRLEAHRVPVRQAERGRRIDLGGGAMLELLSPPIPPLARTRSDVNANSVVARLDFRGLSVLFAADAEAATERWLLESGARLEATVLKVAHHGSRFSSGPGFLAAVRPRIAVVSVGARNRYRHPAPSTVRRLESLGAQVYRTDQDGDIILEMTAGKITVGTSRAPASELVLQ